MPDMKQINKATTEIRNEWNYGEQLWQGFWKELQQYLLNCFLSLKQAEQ